MTGSRNNRENIPSLLTGDSDQARETTDDALEGTSRRQLPTVSGSIERNSSMDVCHRSL